MENKSTIAVLEKIALVQYPPLDDPEFDLNKDGRLMIFGYKTLMMGKKIGTALCLEVGVKDFVAVGRYDYALTIIGSDLTDLLRRLEFDEENTFIAITREIAEKHNVKPITPQNSLVN